MRIVLDTNVLVAALRSRRGSSYRLISHLGGGKFTTCVSVPLVVEYEKVLVDQVQGGRLSRAKVRKFINYMCNVSHRQKVYFLWRPFLPHPKDDMLLELAVAARSKYILTFNLRDFRAVEQFGIEAITPKQFLERIGEVR